MPVVFVQVSDPVKLGFIANLARPGGNMTGFANFEHPIGGKWLELLKDTAPGRNRVAVLVDPDNPSQTAYLQAVESAAPAFGVQLIRADVRDAAEIETAIVAFAQQPNGALLVAPNAVTIAQRDFIIALAAQRVAIDKRADAAHEVAADGQLDLDHLGPEIGEQGGRKRRGDARPEVEDTDTGKRQVTLTASCGAQSRVSCRFNCPASSSWWSISRPPRRSASASRRRSCSTPTK